MTQHIYLTEYQGRSVTILMGWDRPLQGFFLVIEESGADDEQYLYSNLDDPGLADCGGLPPDLAHFLRKLKELGLTVPEAMIRGIKIGGVLNAGKRYVRYDNAGNELTAPQ